MEDPANELEGHCPARRTSVPHPSAVIDLKDPDIHSSPRKQDLFAKLRIETPIAWIPEVRSSGFWAVTRYRDVVKILKEPFFSADISNGGMRIFDIQDVAHNPQPHILSMDPPQHTELRKALLPLFSQLNMARLRPLIEARAARLVDAIAGRPRAEFVGDIAAPLTLGFLADLLGVPETDGEKLLCWSNCLIGEDDPEFNRSMDDRQLAIVELDAYALELFESRRNSGSLDLPSLLRNAMVEGKAMDFACFSENIAAMIIAGNETTRHAITGAIIAFSEFPAEKERLIEDRSLIPAAVKEIIRWATPIIHVRRTATRDVEMHGELIRKGDKVVVWYSSANRDEETWDDAMRFDVLRYHQKDAVPHLSFGAGPHYCLGWRFAELQLEIIIEELLRRLPDIRAAAPPRLLRSNFVSGIKELQVAFTPEVTSGNG